MQPSRRVVGEVPLIRSTAGGDDLVKSFRVSRVGLADQFVPVTQRFAGHNRSGLHAVGDDGRVRRRWPSEELDVVGDDAVPLPTLTVVGGPLLLPEVTVDEGGTSCREVSCAALPERAPGGDVDEAVVTSEAPADRAAHGADGALLTVDLHFPQLGIMGESDESVDAHARSLAICLQPVGRKVER